MNDKDRKSPQTQRRRLLSAVAVAGAAGASRLPEKWQRPVIDHALLPAHAQMTFEGTICAFSISFSQFRDYEPTGNTSGTFTFSETETIFASRDWDSATFSTVSSTTYTGFHTDINSVTSFTSCRTSQQAVSSSTFLCAVPLELLFNSEDEM